MITYSSDESLIKTIDCIIVIYTIAFDANNLSIKIINLSNNRGNNCDKYTLYISLRIFTKVFLIDICRYSSDANGKHFELLYNI